MASHVLEYPRKRVYILDPAHCTTDVITGIVRKMDEQHSSMGQPEVFKHYKDVAGRYDELYAFCYHYVPNFAIKHLQLKSDDLLADIGAGTGAITHLIWKEAGLTSIQTLINRVAQIIQFNTH